MKKHYLLLILGCMLLSVPGYTQTGQQKDTLRAIAAREAIRSKIKKAQAVEWAKQNGYPVTQEKDGTFIEIQYIDEKNRPQYYGTDNATAAASISTNQVYSGGSAGLSLSGAGISVRVWDAGSARATHQEFGGRVTVVDAVATHYHSTHVAGTIMASGVVANAKGMAYEASLRSLDWNSDASEMASEAAAGALISNHSYGYIRGWYGGTTWYGDPDISTQEDYLFGFYNQTTQLWDQIAQNAPNFLICKSAGNDRGDSGDGSYPPDGPYDCIGEVGIAKNIMTVGAVYDIPGGYANPSDVVMSDFSSWGPADDGRIKPDIVANGIGLYSTYNGSDTEYASISGTSMATPSVAGSLALLQQHYMALKGSYMHAATLKALVIHTADEAGTYSGPDYKFGWGLMNTKNAALKITENQTIDVINELTLTNGSVFTRDIIASGDPIKVTIVWTDPAGTPVAAALDPINPMLVNDLDLRITKAASTWYPWKLDRDNPANAATNSAENNVDNVELVYIASPAAGETYTITIDHDGTLTGTSQDFSIIVSGALGTVPPVANFAASTTHPVTNTQVNFTDMSVNHPTSWSWSFNPSTVTYLNETNSTSQNPQVMFTATGSYSVTLVSTNAYGSDTETKTDYITAISCTYNTLPFIEGFSGTIIPDCWTQVDHQGNGQVWQFGAITGYAPLPSLTGNYAYINSDAYGYDNTQNADLITPTLDLSSYSDVSLQFDHYFQSYTGSSGTVAYSIDGGDSWTTITTFNATTANPATFNQVIPEVTGQSNVKFKWNYTGSWGYYWGIDNVEITGTMSAEPDLAVSALIFTPTSGAGGTVLGISTTIKNIGTANTGASSTIKYYFSSNTTWESTDTYIGMDGVGDLAPEATSPETINWTIPTSLAVGSYYVIVRVDVNNTVTESDESNDFPSAATFAIIDMPDLAVSALTFTPAYGARGSVLNISTTVKNIGTAVAGATSIIKYYFSANATWESTDTYIGMDGVGDLAPDATSPETISWTIPTTLALGDYYVIVRVDVNNTVTELVESNNFPSATTFSVVEKPDLVVSALTFDPISGVGGTVLNISTTIKNIGTASATAASTIRYYFSENTTWESTDPYIGVDGVGILAVGGTSPETISWTVPTSLAVGNYYVIVRVDVNSTVVELDESNDFASVATFGVIEKPDLVISALTFTPTSGARGTVLNISTIVKNIGTISSGAASTIKYYFSANTTWESTDTYIGVDGVGDLAADGTSPETISWTVPLSVAVGSYYVIVRADAGNTVSESNESNNFASATTFDIVEQPDLVVSSLTFDPTIGARGTILNISTTVKNIGTISSGAASTIRYYFSENSTWESTDPYIGVDGVGDLAVGGTSPETISWTVPLSVAVGSYYVIVRADAGNTVSESDESNDFASATTFDIVEQPDLVISALTFTPTAGAVGSVLNISTTVKNIGTATSGAASTIRYYFSANSTWESTDQYIGVDGVGDLTVGGTSPETISWTIPASLALGTYYVIVRVDVNNTVIESDESNDFASVTTFEVADKPDLVISALTFTPTSGVGGTVLNISTTVKNIGTATSGAACTIRYYFSVNNTWQSTDPYIGVDGVGDLAVNATSPETISWAVPASLAAGSYYVIVRVDVTNTVSELNESNVFVSAAQFVISSEPSIGGGGDGKATLDLLVREDPQMKSYPNPFVDQTTIHYTLAEESKVLLRVYDMYGNLVFNLIDEKIETGPHQVDLEGRFIAKGMYYCVLTTPKGNYTLKMIKE